VIHAHVISFFGLGIRLSPQCLALMIISGVIKNPPQNVKYFDPSGVASKSATELFSNLLIRLMFFSSSREDIFKCVGIEQQPSKKNKQKKKKEILFFKIHSYFVACSPINMRN
jgi:hypothetical protein